MNKKIKCVAALLAMLAASKAGAWNFTSGGIYYRIINDEEVAIARAVTDTGESLYDSPVLIVPQQVYFDGMTYRVAAVDDHAFVGSALTEVQLPMSVTSSRLRLQAGWEDSLMTATTVGVARMYLATARM